MQLVRVTDEEVKALLAEAKPIPGGLCPPQMLGKNGFYRKSFEITGHLGSEFVVKLRQTLLNPANFSVILGYRIPGTYSIFRLRRYNGKHEHSNTLEKERFRDFHVHVATERYQIAGFNEDHFAYPTDKHFDLRSAIESLQEECGFDNRGLNYSLFHSK